MKKTITLKKNEDGRISGGHLWAFSNEIREISGAPETGDIVHLRASSGKFLGLGFYNAHSLIAARVLTTVEEEISFDFFHRRILSALEIRQQILPEATTFRVVHGESDFLPGLVIDRYNDIMSVQTFSAGMDKRLTLICDVIESILQPKGIVERNESPLRALEGLDDRKGVLRGTPSTTTITENGIQYEVHPLEGQKTGFFLDQRENRKIIQNYARDHDVLDCFCNEGGFALNAAHAGARSVTGIDISEQAITRAVGNSRLNGFEKTTHFACADVFDSLEEAHAKGRRYELVILDPPAFAKNRKSVHKAARGYGQINAAAIGLLQPGGILATSSCSHHISDDQFVEIIAGSAAKARRFVRLLDWRGAGPDHPVHPAMPETKYLKFGVFWVE